MYVIHMRHYVRRNIFPSECVSISTLNNCNIIHAVRNPNLFQRQIKGKRRSQYKLIILVYGEKETENVYYRISVTIMRAC